MTTARNVKPSSGSILKAEIVLSTDGAGYVKAVMGVLGHKYHVQFAFTDSERKKLLRSVFGTKGSKHLFRLLASATEDFLKTNPLEKRLLKTQLSLWEQA